MCANLLQSCPTLCDSMDCSPPGSSVHGDSPGKNTGVGCYALLQGIFLTRDRTRVSRLLYWQVGSLPPVPPGKPHLYVEMKNILRKHIYKLFPSVIMTRSAVLTSIHWACPECPVHSRVLSTRLRTFLCIISYHLLHIPLRCVTLLLPFYRWRN